MEISEVPHAAVIESIERAITTQSATELAATLTELTAAGRLADQKLFAPARTECYQRRLVWCDPKGRFIIVAMTWAPDQGAPLHDHGGLWGSEIVVRGAMREERYRALERDPARGTRFERSGERVIGPGASGILEPPLEYHAYRNATRAVANTLHVYAGPLDTCTVYALSGGDWWTGEPAVLTYSC